MSRARVEQLEVGGVTYPLRWDMYAVATVEELTKENAFLPLQLSVRNVLAILWAAMDAAAQAAEKDTPMTRQQLGSHFGSDQAVELLPIVARLTGDNSYQPDAEEPDEEDPPAPAAGRSGPSPTGTPSDA